MRYLLVFVFVLSTVSVFSIDFLDDFEDYTVNDDLADSVFWMKDDTGGDFNIANDGGDKIIESDFAGGDPIYACLGAGFNEDVAIDMEFEYNGYDSYVALVARLDPDTEIAYAAGLYFNSLYISGAGIYYVEGSTQTELWSGILVPPIAQDSWHNLKFEVSGTNPVHLEVFVDGSSKGSHDDSTYLIPIGLTGLTSYYDASAPTIHIDDFNVDEIVPVAIESASLGSIKAVYK